MESMANEDDDMQKCKNIATSVHLLKMLIRIIWQSDILIVHH